jgi:hypothetical protein
VWTRHLDGSELRCAIGEIKGWGRTQTTVRVMIVMRPGRAFLSQKRYVTFVHFHRPKS